MVTLHVIGPSAFDLARLYPLGGTGRRPGQAFSDPVEADGSFRMNANIRDGIDAYLLVGAVWPVDVLRVRRHSKPLLQLGDAKPAFALVWWTLHGKCCFKPSPASGSPLCRDILGTKIPIAGGYTLGQIAQQRLDTQVLKSTYSCHCIWRAKPILIYKPASNSNLGSPSHRAKASFYIYNLFQLFSGISCRKEAALQFG
ncbi:MAG: hypothetical protein IPN96_15890 [Anaerolineales bacterium]|nr:hypothetical protein [Anaerolineales bacterium]